VPTLPDSLDRALEGLEADHEFLLKGGVFNRFLIERWVAYKRQKEIDPIKKRPHPLEFEMYLDV
jgi:glutamine synthetase